VALLKKELYRQQPAREACAKNPRKRTSSSQFDDDDWNPKKKQIKRTYSGRPGKASNGHRGRPRLYSSAKDRIQFIPGAISVPTPILNRARGDLLINEPRPLPLREDILDEDRNNRKGRPRTNVGDAQYQLSDSMRELKRKTPAITYGIYEGIYNGLEALLKVTAPEGSSVEAKGPKSLLSMCLRMVPKYIADEEQIWEKELRETERSINCRDISTEVYDDLETLGTSGRGCKHLRVVVRSHGIQVISDAIEAGLLDTAFCSILITLCIHTKARKDGEVLLSSLISSGNYPPPKSISTRLSDDLATLPLSFLTAFAEQSGSASLLYRQLSSMIADGRLHSGWLATREFSSIWTKAIQDVSSSTVDVNILKFIDIALHKLAMLHKQEDYQEGNGILSEAATQTFSSLLTTICSIIILSNRTSEQSKRYAHNSDLPSCEHIVSLLRGCLVESEMYRTWDSQGLLLMLANLIVGSHEDDKYSGHDLARLLVIQLRRTKQYGSELVDLICSIARCCGRGTSTMGFGYLKNLHLSLESVATTRETDGANLLHEIIVDSAFSFAQQVPDSSYLNYATSTEAKFHVVKTKHVGSTPRGSGGFRWEEGISEWVTATPAVKKIKLKSNKHESNYSDPDTPFRPRLQNLDSVAAKTTSQQPTFTVNRNLRIEIVINRHQHSPPLKYYDSDSDSVDSSGCMDNSTRNTSVCSSGDEFNGDSPVCQNVANLPPTPPRARKTSSRYRSASSIRNVSNLQRLRQEVQEAQKWNPYEDSSDDELSFLDNSSQDEPALRNVPCKVVNTRRGSRRVPGRTNKSFGAKIMALISDSEDELCS